ncbi:MAG: hypothetical protein K2K85_00790, partial [Clostridia bacterium]|nr:hypothetical protein [Clostridia bacterium]
MLKKRKSIKYLIMSIALLLCITIAIMSGAQSFDSVGSIPTTPMTDATLDAPYSALCDGATYRFTDYAKIEDMHSGAISDDTKQITIDSTEAHGSQLNPYVIDSVATWNAFATAMNTAPNGQGKFFLLAEDLDFTSQTFAPVATFKGTFYGGGHSLKNISYTFASSGDCATFKVIDENTIICDLNITDATFTGVGNHNAILCASSSGGKILNCHATGTISTSTTVSNWVATGGILAVSISTTPTTIYRCSVNVKATISNKTNEGSGMGVISGATYNGGQLIMLDCYGIMENQYSANVDLYGGIAGMSYNAGDMRIENCISDINYKNMELGGTDSTNYHPTSLFSFWMATQHPSKVVLKNTYVSGKADKSGVEYSIYPDIIYSTHATTANSIAIDVENFNWYSLTGASKLITTTKWMQSRFSTNANATMYDGDKKDFWDVAKSDSSFSSSIWTNKSAIGASNYSVSNTPLKNTSIKASGFTIKYANLESGAEKEYVGNATTYNYKDTTQLYTPTAKNNHVFVGWTLDKTGNGAIYKNIPNDFYGDVTMYAVWDVPQASVTKESIISAESDGAFTKEYSQGSSLTMRGDISVTSMTSPVI